MVEAFMNEMEHRRKAPWHRCGVWWHRKASIFPQAVVVRVLLGTLLAIAALSVGGVAWSQEEKPRAAVVETTATTPTAETPSRTETPDAPKPPLYEEKPYDLILLTVAAGGERVEVEPLDIPDRLLPDPLPRIGTLRVHKRSDPSIGYDVPWNRIAAIRLFEQTVLIKANKLVAAGKFEEAYDHFAFLEALYPNLEGLVAATEASLYEEAKISQRADKYDAALALLNELHSRNANYPNLSKAIGLATDRLVARYMLDENYRVARILIDNLAANYPDHSVVVKRIAEMERIAGAALARAKTACEAGQWGKAWIYYRRAVWSKADFRGRAALEQRFRQQPFGPVVGVSLPANGRLPGQLNDPAARRSGRLLHRALVEFTGPGIEGGQYVCPLGDLTIDEFDFHIAIRLRHNIGAAQDGNAPSGAWQLTGGDVARRLAAMARPGEPVYVSGWSELLDRVSVHDVFSIDIALRRDHVRPDAFLQAVVVPLEASRGPGQSPSSNGPFVVVSRDDDLCTYERSPSCFATTVPRSANLIEWHYRKGIDAIAALRRGDVAILDHVNPWSVAKLRQEKSLVVAPYRLPMLHCLIPNRNRPLTTKRAFRRALVYAIHRSAILEHLTAGGAVPGGQVVSGPFLPGNAFDDPIGYAYDAKIQPRPYEPRLATTLITLANRELAEQNAAAAEGGEAAPLEMHLVLAHQADETTRIACQSIQGQLALLGVKIVLKEFEGPPPDQVPDDVDLLYAVLAMWEPVIDARRLLAADGMVGGCSPHVAMALRRLDAASGWQEVQRELRLVHRCAHDDVAIIPLWQMTDFFAYRKGVEGVGTRPITLYENVEQWKYVSEETGAP